MVVVRESDKGPYFLNGRWRFLLIDSCYLLRVDLNPLADGDDKPEIFHRLYFELILIDI